MPGEPLHPLDALLIELQSSSSAPDLFRRIYAYLAEADRPGQLQRLFRKGDNQIGKEVNAFVADLDQDLRVLRMQRSSVSWSAQFDLCRNELLSVLGRYLRYPRVRASEPHAVGSLAAVLRGLDDVVGAMLERSNPPTFPSLPDRTGFTVVWRGRPLFERLRDPFEQEHGRESKGRRTEKPLPLEHDAFPDVLGLNATYVVSAEDPSVYSGWTARWLPRVVDARLSTRTTLRVALVSCPHDEAPIGVAIDEASRTFRVSCHPDDALVNDVAAALDLEIANQATIIVLPELMANDRFDALVAARLRQPHTVGLVLPGSRHVETQGESGPDWRNEVVGVGPGGSRHPEIRHHKVSTFPLPRSVVQQMSPALHAEVLEGKEVTEGIATIPRALTVFHSRAWGRIAIAICRDLLEAPFQAFCRAHRPDHVIVLAMTQDFADFDFLTQYLGRELGIGFYVVNAGFSTHVSAGTVYVPFRSVYEEVGKSLHRCADGHRVCVTTVDLTEGSLPKVSRYPVGDPPTGR